MHKCKVLLSFHHTNRPTKMQITTTTEMILAIAKAINELDVKTLLKCRMQNSDWLQSPDECEAMEALIEAALEAVESIR